jgi:hypothetical protein
MSRPRVNDPRSLIITTVEAPVREFVTFTRVPNGSLLCAAVRPSGRNGWPLAVYRPELYWVAFIEPLGQVPWVDPARAMPPNQVETSNRGMIILNAIVSFRFRLGINRARIGQSFLPPRSNLVCTKPDALA